MAEYQDPLQSFRFRLDLGEKAVGFFTECSGLGSESEVVEHNYVDEKGNEHVGKTPGRLKWQEISLKRPITSAVDLWDWQKEVDEGQLSGARINGSVVMLSTMGDPIAQWDFDRGWLKKIEGPQMKSDSNDVTMEGVTIVHEGLWRVAV